MEDAPLREEEWERLIERCPVQACRSTPERAKSWVPGDRLRTALADPSEA